MQLGRRSTGAGRAADERLDRLNELAFGLRRLRLHIQKRKQRVLDERGNTSIRIQDGMNAGRANRRLGIWLKL